MTTTYTDGQTLYWSRYPSARFTYRGINADGSVALYGGEKGYGSYRDARPDEVRTQPLEGADQVLHYASTNIFAHVTTSQLAEMFDLKDSAVRKVIADNPHIFRRIARGTYEIRDAEADRSAAQ
jgi:hypothetical protein